MNEVMQVRAASWTAMIKQRSDSGLTIKEWCAANGIQESSLLLPAKPVEKNGIECL